jgi:hypothetical protein
MNIEVERISEIVWKLTFLIDNIFAIFQQTVGIPMGTSTNCAVLFDLFLYSYNAGLKQGLLKKEKLDRFLKCMLCYTDAFSLNIS